MKHQETFTKLLDDTEKALKWANSKPDGFSDAWVSGYGKAYEQVKNDLLALKK